jgi:hypothetical protein
LRAKGETHGRLFFAQYHGKIQSQGHRQEFLNYPDRRDYILREKMIDTEELLLGGGVFLVIDLPNLTKIQRPNGTQEVVVRQVLDLHRKRLDGRANHPLAISPEVADVAIHLGKKEWQRGN